MLRVWSELTVEVVNKSRVSVIINHRFHCRPLEQRLQPWLAPACWFAPFRMSTARCLNTSPGCFTQVWKRILLVFVVFFSPTSDSEVGCACVSFFFLKVWWVPSLPHSLCWAARWWSGRPGTQLASWEACPPWPCVLPARSFSTWAARWLLASAWSLPLLLVSLCCAFQQYCGANVGTLCDSLNLIPLSQTLGISLSQVPCFFHPPLPSAQACTLLPSTADWCCSACSSSTTHKRWSRGRRHIHSTAFRNMTPSMRKLSAGCFISLYVLALLSHWF